jgi:hypothetical protein
VEQAAHQDENHHCPACGSANVAPAEKEFKSDYPLSVALIVVIIFFLLGFALFFLLQLHPVILILVGVAVVSWFLKSQFGPSGPPENIDFICLDCEHRFQVHVAKTRESGDEIESPD